MRGARTASVLLAVALLLGGCGDVNKGSAKAADFERALLSRHGEVIEDVSSATDNLLPWSGSFHATVTLRPTAAASSLEEVEATVASLLADSGDTAGLRANGLEICPSGERRAQHLALREQLRADSRSLVGRLDCDTYAGDLAAAAADIALVQSALASAGAARDLPVDGRISSPRGELGGLWRDLTPHLAEAVGSLDAADLNSFTLQGRSLDLNVQPGVDADAVRTSVAATAPEVALTVRSGAAHGEDWAPPASAGRLRADVGALPGVVSVRFVSASEVVVRVAAPSDVAPTVAAARARAASDAPVHLHVTTQADDDPSWTVDRGADYEIDAGSTPAHLDGFAALVGDAGISAVGWREPGDRQRNRQVTISAPGGGDLRVLLPRVKEHVPVGTDLNLHLGEDDYYFDVAPSLDPADGQGRELSRSFVDAWNALPSDTRSSATAGPSGTAQSGLPEGIPPQQQRGHYREYGDRYWTSDHDDSFRQIQEGQ